MTSIRATVLTLALLSSLPAWAMGAIAVDTEHGQKAGDEGYGIGWGTSRNAASADALRECQSAGNTHCKVLNMGFARVHKLGGFKDATEGGLETEPA